MASKRALGEEVETGGETKRSKVGEEGQVQAVSPEGQPQPPQQVQVDLALRFLIDNKQVGMIIGKHGSNVTRIRNSAGIYCSILKVKKEHQTAATERVMVLKGTQDSIAGGCKMIAEVLIDNNRQRAERNAEQNGEPVKAVSEKSALKMLIHLTHAGSLIGKGGAIIKETQELTGAHVSISESPLPGSSEKTVTITGTPQNVHDAMKRIITQLNENPLKPGTAVQEYVPGPPEVAAPPPGYYPPPPHGYPYYPPRGYAPPPAHSKPAGGPTISLQGQSQQKIAIPTQCAGSVIGKGGAIITDIKQKSGCQISIADSAPQTPEERVVTLSGTPQAIQTAITLIKNIVESFVPSSPQGYAPPAHAHPSYAPQPGAYQPYY